jgi:hypothetical protein
MPKGFVWATLKRTGHKDIRVLVPETAVTADGTTEESIHNLIYSTIYVSFFIRKLV